MRAPILVAAAMVSGCSSYVGRFSVLGVHPAAVEAPSLGLVHGKSCTWIDVEPNLGRAVLRALEEAPGANALVDVAVRHHVEEYVVIRRECFYVEGEAVRLPEQRLDEEP